MKRKPYCYEIAILTIQGLEQPKRRAARVRILRKLVRDAVKISWHRAGDESTADLANRLAKELVP